MSEAQPKELGIQCVFEDSDDQSLAQAFACQLSSYHKAFAFLLLFRYSVSVLQQIAVASQRDPFRAKHSGYVLV